MDFLHTTLDVLAKERYQRLREGIAEDQLRTNDKNLLHGASENVASQPNTTAHDLTYLWCQTLEERPGALVANQILYDRPPGHLLLKVGVLNARLDSIKRRSDRDGSDRTRDGGNEILGPGSL